MKLLMKLQLAAFIAATALSSVVLAAGEQPAWWHSHGHGGGGVTAFGKPGDPEKVSRTVNVDMTDDMRFTPSKVTVKRRDNPLHLEELWKGKARDGARDRGPVGRALSHQDANAGKGICDPKRPHS